LERDLELVEELARLLGRSGASEIEVEVGDLYIRLRRSPKGEEPGSPLAEGPKEASEGEEETPSEAKRVKVRSEYVGLFRPAISEGEEVEEGQTVCYIEVLGVLNEVPSPVRGRVVSLPLGEGDPVEYGQVLAEIEPGPTSKGGGG